MNKPFWIEEAFQKVLATNPVVRACFHAYQKEQMTTEQFLKSVIVLLVKQNNRLVEMVTNQQFRAGAGLWIDFRSKEPGE